MKTSGIYKIQSISHPERCYIGSAIYIKKRWNYHREDLQNNNHHSYKLQRHFNKYGLGDLQFSILLECPKEDLIKNEQKFLDELNPWFNIAKTAGNSLGIKRSDETRDKISKNHADVSGSKNPMFGKPQSKEHTLKVKLNHADISGSKNPMFGKHHSLKSRKKQSEARKNYLTIRRLFTLKLLDN